MSQQGPEATAAAVTTTSMPATSAAAVTTTSMPATSAAATPRPAAGANRRAETQVLAITPLSGRPVTELRNANRGSGIKRRNRNGNEALMPPPPPPSQPFPAFSYRLGLKPDADHNPDCYEDLQLDFSPVLFSSLERYLPPTLLNSSRDIKVHFMRGILSRYATDIERNRIQKHWEYRQKIMSNYQPLYRDLYTINAANFFVPSFLNAVSANTEESFRSVMSEPSPGVFRFEMLQPRFCEMLLAEVENFEKWVCETKFRIMRPTTMNRYGVVLDDFGLETMLDKLMEEFICPLSRVFFPDVGGSSLDTHHGFVVEYGMERDVDVGFHVDDSDVTLNVCLGKQFSGGELFFRGVRCDKHVDTETQPEEIFDCSHVAGWAILHRGCHRHGARATTSGQRINLVLWCRSSSFRQMRKYQKKFAPWCAECQREKKERQHQCLEATKLESFIGGGGEAAP